MIHTEKKIEGTEDWTFTSLSIRMERGGVKEEWRGGERKPVYPKRGLRTGVAAENLGFTCSAYTTLR